MSANTIKFGFPTLEVDWKNASAHCKFVFQPKIIPQGLKLSTLGKIDFRPLRKFNGANFYICFAFLSEEPKIIEKIDLAKCPF